MGHEWKHSSASCPFVSLFETNTCWATFGHMSWEFPRSGRATFPPPARRSPLRVWWTTRNWVWMIPTLSIKAATRLTPLYPFVLQYMAIGCWSPKCAFVWKCGTVPQIHQNWLFLVAYPIFKHCHIHYSLVNYPCFIVKSPFNLWFPMTRGCPCLGQHPEELLATVLLAVSTLLDASWPMDE